MPKTIIIRNNSEQDVYSVSQLNRISKQILEQRFPKIRVEGEISNLSTAYSGHIYFTLKDENAQIRCACFRSRKHWDYELQEGMQVLITANVSLYEARGDYQLIVQDLEPSGEGALAKAFVALKNKLEKAGYFDSKHKQVLPQYPHCIGIITSPKAAALADILTTIERRYPATKIIIYPSEVQGAKAAAKLAQAIERANQRAVCDVLLLARGGGSLEDLWAFNEIILAKAIFASKIPIISGVGHEVDFTIADFVADARAPTPTGAAEMLTPDKLTLMREVDALSQRLFQRIRQILLENTRTLQSIQARLRHPLEQIANNRLALLQLYAALKQSMQHHLARKRYQHQTAVDKLQVLSPLATLDRGYAIASDAKGHIPTHANAYQVGDTVDVRLAEGVLGCEIKTIRGTK